MIEPVSTPAAWPPPPPVPGRVSMPGTVLAAVIVTYICAALTIVLTLAMVVFVAFIGSFVASSFRTEDNIEIGLTIAASAAAVIGTSLLACWFAWQTGRRKGWARIALAVYCVVVIGLAILTVSPPSAVALTCAVAVLVLLFVPESRDWFDQDAPYGRQAAELRKP